MVKRQVDEAMLIALIQAGVVREAVIARVPHNGEYRWAIQIKYGLNTQLLRSKREPIRLFRTIDTAAKLLHGCGLHHMQIDYA